MHLTAEEAPTPVTASVDGSSLVLTYDEYLDTNLFAVDEGLFGHGGQRPGG